MNEQLLEHVATALDDASQREELASNPNLSRAAALALLGDGRGGCHSALNNRNLTLDDLVAFAEPSRDAGVRRGAARALNGRIIEGSLRLEACGEAQCDLDHRSDNGARRLLAAYHTTKPGHLERLAADPWPVVASAAMTNEHATSTVIATAVRRHRVSVRRTGRRLKSEDIDSLLDDDPSLAVLFAHASQMALATIRRLAVLMPATCAAWIAQRPDCPPDMLKAYCAGDDPHLARAAAANPAIALHIPALLDGELCEDALVGFAKNPRCDAAVVDMVLATSSVRVAAAALENPAFPSEISRWILLGGSHPAGAISAALTPAGAFDWTSPEDPAGPKASLPADVVSALATGDVASRRLAARYWALPPALNAALARDDDSQVRSAIAYREDTATGDLAILAGDADPEVQEYAFYNQRVPGRALDAQARHPDPEMRFLIAGHPAISATTATALLARGGDDAAAVLRTHPLAAAAADGPLLAATPTVTSTPGSVDLL